MEGPLRRVLVSTVLAFCPLPAQDADDPIARLTSSDWRERNAAARALVDGPADVAALLGVLAEPWSGTLPDYAQSPGWGASMPGRVEPRAVVLEAVEGRIGWARAHPSGDRLVLTRVDALCCPLHPHELALFVLQSHDARAGEPPFGPVDAVRADAWLLLVQPDRDRLDAALSDDDAVEPLVAALWRQGPNGRQVLRELLRTGPLPVQDAIVGLQQKELVDDAALLRHVAERLASTWSLDMRKVAAALLVAADGPVAEVLAELLANEPSRGSRGHLLAVLSKLEERARPARTALLQALGDGRVNRHFALYTLGAFDPAPDLAADTARAAMQHVPGRDLVTGSLALDVLARCGDAVTPAQRAELLRLLRDPEQQELAPRLLGCLGRLGALPADLDTAPLADLVARDTATLDTWLAIADGGPDAVHELLPHLLGRLPYEVRNQVRARVARSAPDVVRSWLEHRDPDVRTLALQALHAADAVDAVSPERLVAMLDEPEFADEALDWLGQRRDASALAPQVFALLIERSGDEVSSRERRYFENVPLPAAMKLGMLTPLLRTGQCWDAVEELGADVLRQDLRRWVAEAEGEQRQCLLADLCSFGLQGEQEVAWVAEALGEQQNGALFDGLLAGPSLPEGLVEPLQALFDADQVVTDVGIPYWVRKVLWRFRN